MTTLVFLGDSITDCSRKRASRYQGLPKSLGHGWVQYVDRILNARPNVQTNCWNRGYSGCLIRQLMQQGDWWPVEEGEPVKADITTILLGINDIWHPFWKGQSHQLESAIASYEVIVKAVSQRSNTLVLMEPFALPVGDVTPDWWPLLDQLSHGLEEVADRYDGCHWIALQDRLMKDVQGHSADYLSDGVHPSDLGHRWLAHQWINQLVEQSVLSGI